MVAWFGARGRRSLNEKRRSEESVVLVSHTLSRPRTRAAKRHAQPSVPVRAQRRSCTGRDLCTRRAQCAAWREWGGSRGPAPGLPCNKRPRSPRPPPASTRTHRASSLPVHPHSVTGTAGGWAESGATGRGRRPRPSVARPGLSCLLPLGAPPRAATFPPPTLRYRACSNARLDAPAAWGARRPAGGATGRQFAPPSFAFPHSHTFHLPHSTPTPPHMPA